MSGERQLPEYDPEITPDPIATGIAIGKASAAIEKFKLSSQKGPHFADPLEGWGETLVYAGKKDEAKMHFARAATLDLTLSEKAELANQGDRHV